jgi:hypothetical protein
MMDRITIEGRDGVWHCVGLDNCLVPVMRLIVGFALRCLALT